MAVFITVVVVVAIETNDVCSAVADVMKEMTGCRKSSLTLQLVNLRIVAV